jgi:hypothetical protein
MKLVQGIPELENGPLTFRIKAFTESTAHELLDVVLEKAKEVIGVVTDANKEEWKNAPSTRVRAVFGHWLVNATRHFKATICLCEEHDLSVVADTHHRQIFELYIQARYYASFDQSAKERYAEKMCAIGFIEYLEKMSVLKDHEQLRDTYKEVSDALSHYDSELVDEIYRERKKNRFNWFGGSFSQLASNVSREPEDLKRAYQIISADVHGTWTLAFDVSNPEPGHLDFRGYPDLATMYIRATETLYQVIAVYLNLWNEIAESVGAQTVKFSFEA